MLSFIICLHVQSNAFRTTDRRSATSSSLSAAHCTSSFTFAAAGHVQSAVSCRQIEGLMRDRGGGGESMKEECSHLVVCMYTATHAGPLIEARCPLHRRLHSYIIILFGSVFTVVTSSSLSAAHCTSSFIVARSSHCVIWGRSCSVRCEL